MLGLIKLLAFTAMILNHQANADSDHCHRVHTCRRRGNDKGTQFKLRVKTQGAHEGDHLIGKLMMTSILGIILYQMMLIGSWKKGNPFAWIIQEIKDF